MKPIPGNKIFDALKDTNTIVMATNIRMMNGVALGVFKAAKEMDAAVIIELAKSECDLKGGYTGLTPELLGKKSKEAAKKAGHDIWALHADHTTIKKGDEEELNSIRKLFDAHISAGYTSFAIDASFTFDVNAPTVEKALKTNIESTTKMYNYLREKMKGKEFGIEVEVGEIGYHDGRGNVKTSPEEAVAFIKGLKANGVEPDLLAIANGSAHGNNYDADGNLIPQLSIDVKQTIKVVEALKKAGFDVKIAQHGITGTPREFIKTHFPKKAILKGNVGTFWQNLVWDVLKENESDLFNEITEWTLNSFRKEAENKGIKKDDQIFGLYSKKANGQFFDKLYNLKKSTVDAMESKAFGEAEKFFDAFEAQGSAEIVRKSLRRKSLKKL